MNLEGMNGESNKHISAMTITFRDEKTDTYIPVTVKGCYKDLKRYLEVADEIWGSLKFLDDDAPNVYRVDWGESGIGPGMTVFIDSKKVNVVRFEKLGDELGLDVYSVTHETAGMKVELFCKNP